MDPDYEIIEFINFDNKKISKKKRKKKSLEHDKFILVSEYKPDKKYNLIDDNIYESVIKIEYKNYITEIEESYKYDFSEILNQVRRDFYRERVYINKNRVRHLHNFISYAESRYHNKLKYILMCVTQAIFAMPFGFIQSNLDPGLFLSELGLDDRHKKKIIFDITINDTELLIKIKKKFRIFKFNDSGEDETIHIISVKLYLDLIKEDYVNLKIKKI